MRYDIQKVEYYNVILAEQVAEGSKLLALFAEAGGDLHAFKVASISPRGVRFTLLPKDDAPLRKAAEQGGLAVDGPHPALLIKGGEEPGALAGIFDRLARAKVPVRESSGIADINRGYGVVLYLDQQDCDAAEAALEM